MVVAKRAAKRARDRPRILLLDAAHHHAQMLGLDHDTNARRLQHVVDGLSNLLGQSLLHLQASRVREPSSR